MHIIADLLLIPNIELNLVVSVNLHFGLFCNNKHMYLFFKNLKRRCCKIICPRRRSKDIVIILPYDTQNNRVLLIQEYVYYYDKLIWKFVSGRIDKKGKDPQQHAQEELFEELGMKTENMRTYYTFEKIFKFRKIHVYVAENPIEVIHPIENPDHKHGNYIHDQKWVDYETLMEMVKKREIIWNESVFVALNLMKDL